MDIETLKILIGTNEILKSRRHSPVLNMYIQHALTPGVRTIEDQYSDYLIRRWEVSGK